jgi:hypothetical protein
VNGLLGLLPAAAIGQRDAVVALGQREVGIEPQRRFEFSQRIVEPPAKQIGATERVVSPRIFAVGPDRCQGRPLGEWRHRLVRPTHVDAEYVTGGEQSERLTIVGVDGDCPLQQLLRGDIVLPGHPPVVRQGPHHQVPCIQALRRLAPGAKIFRGIDLRLDRRDDGLRDLVLDREHIGKITVVAFRPDMAAGGHVVELRRDAHALAQFAHAALEHIADAEFLGDLLDVNGLALVGERGIAGDHEEPTQFGQRRDDVFADAV